MQIYLHQNKQQEGPFTLPRISARLVSGDLDSATLAWHEGMDTWYPLHHEKWQVLGIVAVPPKQKEPVKQEPPAEEVSEKTAVVESSSEEVSPAEDASEGPVEEDSSEDQELVADPEPEGPSFAS